jgi:hypothetical protein
MSVGTQTAGRVPATSTMSVFERYLRDRKSVV